MKKFTLSFAAVHIATAALAVDRQARQSCLVWRGGVNFSPRDPHSLVNVGDMLMIVNSLGASEVTTLWHYINMFIFTIIY